MKQLKRFLAMALVLCMVLSMVPLTAFQTSAEETTFDKIVHLDNGRKYYSADWIKALITEMSAAGYTQLQLAFGNDGLRFLLDDMSVTVNGTTYTSANVTAGVQAGNKAYYDDGANELTEAEMDAIIAHAQSKGIEIVPHLNMPGHMDAILDAIEYVGISDAHFTGYTESVRSLNLNNDTAVAFAQALLSKYVEYFDAKGCKYFHIGADEFGNDAYGTDNMGFPNMGATLYTKFANYVNACAEIVTDAGMTPRAWNDGISYGSYNDSFDSRIQITYWSSGWSGYDVASATSLSSDDHDMINTNGDYYYVLGKSDRWTSDTTATHDPSLYTEASAWDNTAFMGSTVSNPVGSMFCIWADYPDAETETQVAANTRLILRAMAAEMQGNDAASISTEVVSGGFNADGTINTDAETEVPETSEPETTVEAIPNAPATMTVGSTATLSVGASATWTSSNESVISLEAVTRAATGESVLATAKAVGEATITAKTDATTYTADITVTAADTGEATSEKTINVTIGESVTELIADVNLTGNTYTPDPAGIATVTTAVHTVTASKSMVEVTSASDIVSGGKYLIVEKDGTVLTANGGSYYDNINLLALNGTASAENTNVWTITANGNYYNISSGTNSYLTFDTNTASVSSSATNITLTYSNSYWTLQANGDYLNDFGNAGQAAGGWYEYDANANWKIYRIVETQAEGGTDVTFTGVAVGTTYVTINGVKYTIIVSKKAVTANVVLDGTRTFEDSSFNVTVADSSVATATLSNGTLTITGKKVGTTTVTTDNAVYTIHVIEEDLDAVTPLTIEYWITNSPITDTNTNLNYVSISAEDVYSENGVAVADIVVATTLRENRTLEFWQAKLLDTTLSNSSTSGTEEQTTANGDDETLTGSGFTRVRYWNGAWQVLVGSTWTNVEDEHQLVAYYLEIINIQNANGNTELSVNAADWGFASGEDWGYYTGGYTPATVSIQLVYEDGSTNPGDTTVNTLLTKTLIYGYWDGGRGLGTMIFNGEGYEIYKVTAETGDATYTNNDYGYTINGLTWDGNEETVFEDEAGVESAAIGNPSRAPSYTAPYDNLTWNTTDYNNNNAILIRVYVRAVEAEETEDLLKVVYYDEKFGDTLYEYNILVNKGTIFSNDYFDPDPTTFTGNAERIDVSNAGIVNTNGQTQYFQTDLTQVPEAVGKYNSALYEYTGSVISEDGKTLYLYYNIDQTALSPNYVIDFGLPITFPLSDVVKSGIDTVESVTVNENTRYGTLSYDADKKEFTYTPTTVLPNIDVLTINILFDGETAATTTNVGMTPATTVYYEENFAELNGFSVTGNSNVEVNKHTVAGANYGHTDAYTAVDGTYASSTAAGDTATFTFTGTGVQIYANCYPNSGVALVTIQNAETGAYEKFYQVDTHMEAGTTDATSGQAITAYSLPIVSVQGLTHGKHTVTITNIVRDLDESGKPIVGPLQLDGFRVFGTLRDHSAYIASEQNPTFVELRDEVLTALNAQGLTESIYDVSGKFLDQVLTTTNTVSGAVVVSNSNVYDSDEKILDLLDNGPKNELFLYEGQAVTFTVNAKYVQVGLKAVNNPVTCSINGTAQDISTSTDMFYNSPTGQITITNVNDNDPTTNNVLSVTLLKVVSDTAGSSVDTASLFGEVTAEQMVFALRSVGYVGTSDTEEPDTTEPEVPEDTTVPEETVPETTVPETTVPETTAPETTGSEEAAPETTKATEPKENGSSKTGDDFQLLLWTGMMLLSVLAIMVLTISRKSWFVK